jgi:hypothetical protein
MDVNVVRLEIVGRIHLAQARDNYHPLVNMGDEPLCSTECGEIFDKLRKF